MTNAVNLASAAGTGFIRNRIINGDMRIAQRTTASQTMTGGGVWPVDRFFAQASGFTGTTQQVLDAPANTGLRNCTRMTVTSPNSDNNFSCNYTHRIEGTNLLGLGFVNNETQGSTLSFWVKSSVTGSYSVTLGTGYRAGASYAYAFTLLSYTVNAANTWEYKTLYVPPYSGAAAWQYDNGVGLEITFNVSVGSSFSGLRNDALGTWVDITSVGYFGGASSFNNTTWGKTNGATWNITGVQMEPGSVGTPFEERHFTHEQLLCQRYYTVSRGYMGLTNQELSGVIYFPVTMRTAPSLTQTGSGGAAGSLTGTDITTFCCDWWKSNSTTNFYRWNGTFDAEM